MGATLIRMHNFVVLTADQVLHEGRCYQSFWWIWYDSYQDNNSTVSRTVGVRIAAHDCWI